MRHLDLPEDRPEHEDEEVRDATTVEPFPDGLVEALMDIGRSVDQLKYLPFARKQA